MAIGSLRRQLMFPSGEGEGGGQDGMGRGVGKGLLYKRGRLLFGDLRGYVRPSHLTLVAHNSGVSVAASGQPRDGSTGRTTPRGARRTETPLQPFGADSALQRRSRSPRSRRYSGHYNSGDSPAALDHHRPGSGHVAAQDDTEMLPLLSKQKTEGATIGKGGDALLMVSDDERLIAGSGGAEPHSAPLAVSDGELESLLVDVCLPDLMERVSVPDGACEWT